MGYHQLKMLSTPPVPSWLRSGYDPCYSAAMSFELTVMQDSTANKEDLLDLGRSCVDVCKALERGLEGRQQDELSPSMLNAIEQLTT